MMLGRLLRVFESALSVQIPRRAQLVKACLQQPQRLVRKYATALDQKCVNCEKQKTGKEALKEYYGFCDDTSHALLNKEAKRKSFSLAPVAENVTALHNAGVSRETLQANPQLISSLVAIEEKLKILQNLKWQDSNDFAPLLRLSLPTLRRLVRTLRSEARQVPTGNRIYYLSQQLKTAPPVITAYLVTRLFVLEMAFPMLQKNIALMLEHKVPPLSIIKDLWFLKYKSDSISKRLDRVKQAQKETPMPWMIRCPEARLKRSLDKTQRNIIALGDCTNTVEYLAKRLNVSVAECTSIMDKHPLVHKVQPFFLKKKLDYLLDEAGWTSADIANCPRILCHSLTTTKARLEELKALGCRPQTLTAVCLSVREFEKFKRKWRQFHKQ